MSAPISRSCARWSSGVSAGGSTHSKPRARSCSCANGTSAVAAENTTREPLAANSSARAMQRIRCPTPEVGPRSHRTTSVGLGDTCGLLVAGHWDRGPLTVSSARLSTAGATRSSEGHDTVSELQGSSILITGGTGSFGKAFITHALEHLDPKRLVVFSRDELKQYEVRQLFKDDPRLRWFIGDIRDERRLLRAMHNVDYVVHAAALKQVDTAEYNPFEFVKTNVLGSQNVIEAAIDTGVKKVVALSTDKASSPINLYGATKLTADKLFVTGNHYAAAYPTRFAVVRYGNVMGSRGSVIPFFAKLAAAEQSLPITDLRCTRFFITLPQAVRMVVDTFDMMQGGELLVPKIPSMKVTDLAQAIAPGAKMHDVGLRPGEKLHEEMISPEEGRRAVTVADGKYYVLQPDLATWGYKPPPDGVPVEPGFFFRSDSNDQWYSQEQIREILESGI